jgi:hypothetical protein
MLLSGPSGPDSNTCLIDVMTLQMEVPMAIANYKPVTELPSKPNLPKVEPENYKSILVDTKIIPASTLLAYVNGSPWIVDYYSQVITTDTDIRELDIVQPNVYQQYSKINNLELRVESALTPSYETEHSITTVTGSANVYPFLVPNISDYFITDAADSRKALFRVTSVERKALSTQSIHTIDYEIVGYVDALMKYYDNLESKVISNFYFHKDRLVEGLQPMLKAEETQNVLDLNIYYKELVRYYFNSFYNPKYSTLVIPGQDYSIYDHNLIRYITAIVESTDAPELAYLKTISSDKDIYINQAQFWSIMLQRDYNGLKYCNKKMELVNKRAFNRNAFVHGLAFSNVDYIVYPAEYDKSTLVHDNPAPLPLAQPTFLPTDNTLGNIADVINNNYKDVNTTYPYIKLVTDDPYYVLSENFYLGKDQLSLLEILTKDYLKLHPLDLAKLTDLCKQFRSWGRLEQFYYGPIIITLIKEANRGQYT